MRIDYSTGLLHVQYESNKVHVAGLGEIFVQQKFSCMVYINITSISLFVLNKVLVTQANGPCLYMYINCNHYFSHLTLLLA